MNANIIKATQSYKNGAINKELLKEICDAENYDLSFYNDGSIGVAKMYNVEGEL